MKLNVKKALIIFCFCLVMGGFLWFQHALSASILRERDVIEGLAKQEVSLKGAIAQKYALLEVYRDALSEMEESRVEFPADNVAFFAAIEKVMAGNKLKINKVNPVKSTTPDRTAVLVSCEGDYLNLLSAISDMRGNKPVVRLFSLSIKGQENGPVSADMSLETIMKGE